MNEKKIDEIINLYKNQDFQKNLENQCKEIENKLNDFVKNYNTDIEDNSKIKDKVISRIKSSQSLREKLKRKNYFSKDMENKETEIIFDELKNKLKDMIGFRINCYFKKDEQVVFNSLKTYLEELEFEINDDTIKPAIGPKILKMYCSKKGYSIKFEIQVKSLFHDVWGEVDHKIIYKARGFDSRLVFINQVIESLWGIIEGADNQLSCIFQSNVNEVKTKQELFYTITSGGMEDKILYKHYSNFFSLLERTSNYMEYINQYLGYSLLNKDDKFKKKNLRTMQSNKFTEKINQKADIYKLDRVCEIAKYIFDFENNDQFISYILDEINLTPDKFIKEYNDDTWAEETEEEIISKIEEDILSSFDCIFIEE